MKRKSNISSLNSAYQTNVSAFSSSLICSYSLSENNGGSRQTTEWKDDGAQCTLKAGQKKAIRNLEGKQEYSSSPHFLDCSLKYLLALQSSH